MSGFHASYLELEPKELVRYLLRESGQFERESVNPADLLHLLHLECVSFPFELELPDDAKVTVGGARPRALISFPDRLVAIDSALKDTRARFSALHEIAHFVLPSHEHALYICDDVGLSDRARLSFEREANDFAADMLFLGDRFSLEANSRTISAATIKHLAEKYLASYESTARRSVEKNFRPCMLVTFEQKTTETRVDLDRQATWSVKYCVASAPFKTRCFERVRGIVPTEVVAVVAQPGRDIADSHVVDLSVECSSPVRECPFQAEFFFNQYNIFCLLTPK